MATFWAIVRNEARQLWRQRSFWVIQILLLLPTLLIAFGPPIPATLVLLYLVIPILVGPALLRDAGNPGEIVWSSPTDALTHYMGVITGLWLGLLAGSLLQLSGWFLASLFFPKIFSSTLFIPNNFSFWIWPVSLAFLLLANTVGLFLTALLAMLVRKLAPLLIIWTVSWLWVFMSTTFLPGIRNDASAPMQMMIFNNIFFNNLLFSPSLGLGLSGKQVFGMAAWFLGLALLAASLGLAASLLADKRQGMRRLWILPALILIGALAAVGGYALNTQAAAESAVHISPYDAQIDVWEVNRQQTDVAVNVATGVISGTSQLVLNPVRPPASPELVLRLNPGLKLAYARDGSGVDLPARRMGDSVVVGLPAIPADSIQMELAWHGRLQISYLSFEQHWSFRDFPDEIPYYTMPIPLKALFIPQGGFLLRDGDWTPWPWTSTPHQAGQNSLTIRPVGGEAVAARPIQDGTVTWKGDLPKGLVAFLPSKQIALDDSTLAVSPLAGSQHTARARLLTAAAEKVAARLGEQPPRYVVVAPYLTELVWNGDLLLIPDGSGAYKSAELSWLFMNNANGPKRPLLEQNALYVLARAWMHNHFRASLPFQPVLSPPGEDTQVISITQTTEERWYQGNGHWMQFAEALDETNYWTPVTNYQLNPAGEQSVLAFWLAMELSDEETRQADLNLLAYFASVGQQLQGHSERYSMITNLLWPGILDATKGRELVWNLHEWAARVGPGEAMQLAVEVIQESAGWNQSQIFTELEARSGVPIGEGQ
jgi:hypothetical protein